MSVDSHGLRWDSVWPLYRLQSQPGWMIKQTRYPSLFSLTCWGWGNSLIIRLLGVLGNPKRSVFKAERLPSGPLNRGTQACG